MPVEGLCKLAGWIFTSMPTVPIPIEVHKVLLTPLPKKTKKTSSPVLMGTGRVAHNNEMFWETGPESLHGIHSTHIQPITAYK